MNLGLGSKIKSGRNFLASFLICSRALPRRTKSSEIQPIQFESQNLGGGTKLEER